MTMPPDDPYAPLPENASQVTPGAAAGPATFGAPAGYAAWQPQAQQLRYPLVLTGLRKFAATMLAISAAVAVAAALADAYRLSIVGKLQNSPSESRMITLADRAVISDDFVNITSLLTVLTLLITAVAFIMWLFRGYRNLRWTEHPTRHSPGWAIGGWFIPFANLVLPFIVVKDFWQHTSASKRTSPLVGAWWGCFLAGNIMAAAGARMDTPTLAELYSATRFEVVSDVFWIAAAILGYLMVTRLTQRHDTTIAAVVVNWRYQWPGAGVPQQQGFQQQGFQQQGFPQQGYQQQVPPA